MDPITRRGFVGSLGAVAGVGCLPYAPVFASTTVEPEKMVHTSGDGTGITPLSNEQAAALLGPIAGRRPGQRLERHAPMQPRVFGEADLSVGAGAEAFEDAVRAHAGKGHQLFPDCAQRLTQRPGVEGGRGGPPSNAERTPPASGA